MSHRAKLVTAAALAAGMAFTTAPAHAQYLTHHYYRSAPILHPNARAFYNAQAYYGGGGINVLPVTTVLPLIDGLYDPYDDYHSVYGCCGSTRNNERIGLVGNGVESTR